MEANIIDMLKYVNERLEEVPLEKGRKKEEVASEDEVALTRAAVGSLTWAAKEGRPDGAAGASLIVGCLNQLKIQDIMDLNKIIKEMKKHADLSIQIQPIQEERMCLGVITDASWANAGGGSSQAGRPDHERMCSWKLAVLEIWQNAQGGEFNPGR